MPKADHKQEDKYSKPSVWRLLFASIFVWIIVCLIAVDRFLISVRPLQYVRAGGIVTADQEPLNEKLEALYSSVKTPEYLIFGSSLAVVSCVGSDWKSKGE